MKRAIWIQIATHLHAQNSLISVGCILAVNWLYIGCSFFEGYASTPST